MRSSNKILIIGGCGYIGSRLYEYFKNKKKYERVDTVDLEWFGNFVNHKNIRKDYVGLTKRFYGKYSVVILLAGHSTVGMCERDMLGSLKNNVEGFVDLITKLSSQKFIYTSTYRLYSNIHGRHAKETDICGNPLSIYDLTKKTIDDYISFSSLEFYSLRMATVNGYSPNLRLNQAINKIVYNSMFNKYTEIYNQSSIFSVLGIEDLCRAIEKIILGTDKRGIYNLASFESSINDIVKVASKSLPGVKVSRNKSTKKSIHILIDTSKFQKKFNFKFEETTESIVESLVK